MPKLEYREIERKVNAILNRCTLDPRIDPCSVNFLVIFSFNNPYLIHFRMTDDVHAQLPALIGHLRHWQEGLTLKSTLEGIGLAGKVNSFSTPPVSFQCISRLVGGARSNVVTMSDVLLSWFFISSPDMFFTSSTISLRLRFVFVIPDK